MKEQQKLRLLIRKFIFEANASMRQKHDYNNNLVKGLKAGKNIKEPKEGAPDEDSAKKFEKGFEFLKNSNQSQGNKHPLTIQTLEKMNDFIKSPDEENKFEDIKLFLDTKRKIKPGFNEPEVILKQVLPKEFNELKPTDPWKPYLKSMYKIFYNEFVKKFGEDNIYNDIFGWMKDLE